MGNCIKNESSVISLKGVNKWYGDFQALKDINLEINSKEKISEIPAQKALGILESTDEAVYSTPANYDKLVSIGWKKFVEETEQIIARASSVRLSNSQKWVIEKLMKIGNNKQFDEQKAEIETLRKAFNIPILKGKLNRELLKIKNAIESSDTAPKPIATESIKPI